MNAGLRLLIALSLTARIVAVDDVSHFDWKKHVSNFSSIEDKQEQVECMKRFKSELSTKTDDEIKTIVNEMAETIWLAKDDKFRQSQIILVETKRRSWGADTTKSLIRGFSNAVKKGAVNPDNAYAELSEIWAWIPNESRMYPGDQIVDGINDFIRSRGELSEAKITAVFTIFMIAKENQKEIHCNQLAEVIAKDLLIDKIGPFGDVDGNTKNEARKYLDLPSSIEDLMQKDGGQPGRKQHP